MVIPTMGANPGANQMSEYPDGEDGYVETKTELLDVD